MGKIKQRLSLVMAGIFTAFTMLSGITASAVVSQATAKKQIATATSYVVQAENYVKTPAFNVNTAQAKVNTAQKQVKIVGTYGTAYKTTFDALTKRLKAVQQKIVVRMKQLSDEAAAKKLAQEKLLAAQKAVDVLEELTDENAHDLVNSEKDLTSAQEAVTAALDTIYKIDKGSADYKGLMARLDVANGKIKKAQETIAAKKAEEDARKAAEAAEVAAEAKAETSVAAAEKAPYSTDAEANTALALIKTAQTDIAAVKNADKAKAFTDRITAYQQKVAAAMAVAKMTGVTAAEETILVAFDKAPKSVVPGDFIVTVSVNNAAATRVAPVSIMQNGAAVTVKVPAIAQALNDQSVVYTVTYGNVTLSAKPYIIAAIPIPSVTSVTAGNLKEITVKFNQKVDPTTAASLSNYALVLTNTVAYTWVTNTGIAVYNDSAVLQADGQTVVISLRNGGELMQQGQYTLTVSGVRSPNGTQVMTPQTVKFTALDVNYPTAESVTVTGPTSLRVRFSEPIKPGYTGTYSLDNNTYYLAVQGIDPADNHSVDLTLGTVLPAGNHTLTVSDAYDYTGALRTPSTNLIFNYVVSTAGPTVRVTSVSQTSVVLTFSTAISSATRGYISVYHTYSSSQAYKAGTLSWSQDGITLTATFNGNYIPTGNATIYVNSGPDTTNVARDLWGNPFVSTSIPVVVTADLTPPTVLSTSYVDPTHVDITFSKPVIGVTSTVFTLRNASGTQTIGILGVNNISGNTYRLTTLPMNGDTYVLSIAGGIISDTAVVPNKMAAYSTTFYVTDTLPPTIVGNAVANSAGTNATTIKVTFSEIMATSGPGSVLLTSNYQFGPAGSVAPLPANTIISSTDGGRAVVITFAVPSTLAGKQLMVGRVADAAGNYTLALATPLTVIADSIPASNFINANAISTTTVTIESLTPLASVNYSGFTVGGSPAVAATFVNTTVNNGTVNGARITLTVASANAWVPNSQVTVVIYAGAVTNSIGTTYTGTPITLVTADRTPPSLSSATVTSPNTVTLVYSEAIRASSVNIFTYTVVNNTVANISVSGPVITITLGTPLTYTNATVTLTQVMPIQDASLSANTLPASSIPFTAADGQKPRVASITRTAPNTISVIFSEPVSASTANIAGYYIYKPTAAGSQQAIVSAVLQADGRTVILTTVTDPVPGAGGSTLAISGGVIRDLSSYGNTLDAVSAQAIN